jgi:E3 ubiquitin-protein ligase UBR4
MMIAGSKENYRYIRDRYAVIEHVQHIEHLCGGIGARTLSGDCHIVALDYDNLNSLVDRLKALNQVANYRSLIWQRLCLEHYEVLLRLAVFVPDIVCDLVLDMWSAALRSGPKTTSSSSTKRGSSTSSTKKDHQQQQQHMDEVGTEQQKQQALVLVRTLLNVQHNDDMVLRFFGRYLVETNAIERRWQMHGIINGLMQLLADDKRRQRLIIVDMLWSRLWLDSAAANGLRSAQLVDLLGYYLPRLQSKTELSETAVQLLDTFSRNATRLAEHWNATLYGSLSSIVDSRIGYYLESSPCVVCSHPEQSMSTLKLSSIKLDSRSTTTAQIFKLSGAYELSKVNIRLSELKRSKMVKRINLYYSNKTVGSAVELKNRSELWLKAQSTVLVSGQTEVKIEFVVPIVACNLIIEFAEFYETQKNTDEQMHCPRCSALVASNPGVCSNCGENVYQCAKCRSINYDEKDPFLCNSCGFSKYAKLDVVLYGRQSVSVETIENDQDRDKVVGSLRGECIDEFADVRTSGCTADISGQQSSAAADMSRTGRVWIGGCEWTDMVTDITCRMRWIGSG